ncbi:MAG TPA: antitoxin family protein [Candidatus Limnocylindrales bacterium]|nr:antitoxin family protein [Candidatus Limnocylindrales bacterium]
MTPQPIRAIYRAGNLRLLEPVNLPEGEEVSLVILSDDDRARAALRDILVDPETIPLVEGDADELMRLVADALQGQPSLSDILIEERQSGP